jgi:hypothetical protein
LKFTTGDWGLGGPNPDKHPLRPKKPYSYPY